MASPRRGRGRVLALADPAIERLYLAALIAVPERHGDVVVSDFSHAKLAVIYTAFANARAAGEEITPEALIARLPEEQVSHSGTGDLDWMVYELFIEAGQVTADAPVAGWAGAIKRFAASRDALVEAEEARMRADDEVTDFALRDSEPGPAHARDFARDENSKIYHTQANFDLAIAKLGVTLRYDTFADRKVIHGLPGFGPAYDDHAATRLRLEIDSRFHFKINKEFFQDLVDDRTYAQRFHPVLDHLAALPAHDGRPRVGSWLVDYGGAEDTPYVRAVGRMLLVACVRRVRDPGCIYQELVILESPQGKNKSTALAVLAGDREWFSDDFPIGAESRRLLEATQGRWIMEAPELAGMSRADVNSLKASLSRTHDEARKAYARHTVKVPRQWVPIATTNQVAGYLRDQTGNRRFLPVLVQEFNLEALRRDRDQLWAEACALESAGESIRLARDLYGAANEEQEERSMIDPLEERMDALFGEMTGRVMISDAWKAMSERDDLPTQDESNRLNASMRRLGWSSRQRRVGNGERAYFFHRGSISEQEVRLTVTGVGRSAYAHVWVTGVDVR